MLMAIKILVSNRKLPLQVVSRSLGQQEFLQFSNMRTVWFISFLRAKCASDQDFEVSCVPTAYSFLRRFRYVLAAQFGKFVQPAPGTNG